MSAFSDWKTVKYLTKMLLKLDQNNFQHNSLVGSFVACAIAGNVVLLSPQHSHVDALDLEICETLMRNRRAKKAADSTEQLCIG